MTVDSEIKRAEVTKESSAVQILVADAKKEQEVADEKAKFIEVESIKIEAEA